MPTPAPPRNPLFETVAQMGGPDALAFVFRWGMRWWLDPESQRLLMVTRPVVLPHWEVHSLGLCTGGECPGPTGDTAYHPVVVLLDTSDQTFQACAWHFGAWRAQLGFDYEVWRALVRQVVAWQWAEGQLLEAAMPIACVGGRWWVAFPKFRTLPSKEDRALKRVRSRAVEGLIRAASKLVVGKALRVEGVPSTPRDLWVYAEAPGAKS